MTLAAVVLAGGSGSRVGADRNKALLHLGGEPLVTHSLRRVAALPGLAVMVVVARVGDEAAVSTLLDALRGAEQAGPEVLVVPGGASRHASESAALVALAPRIHDGSVGLVAIHDSARPLASEALWGAVVDAARRHGGAVPVRPAAGVVTAADLHGPPPGEAWAAVQTPQAFRAPELLAAYLSAQREGFEGTDTAACVAAYSQLTVVAVPGEASNLKVTYADDLLLAERLLTRS